MQRKDIARRLLAEAITPAEARLMLATIKPRGRPKKPPSYFRPHDHRREIGREYAALLDQYGLEKATNPRRFRISPQIRARRDMMKRHNCRERQLDKCLQSWRHYVAVFCWEHNLTPDDPIFPPAWRSTYQWITENLWTFKKMKITET